MDKRLKLCPHAAPIDRRTVMRGFVGAVAACGMPVACGGGNGQIALPPSGPVAAGPVGDVPVGTLRFLKVDATHAALLARDAGGLYAMSAVCTHQGCFIDPPSAADTSLWCPCHDSIFDLNGRVMSGPARSPLQHYRVEVDPDGSITIQGGEPVSSAVRTPVE